MADNVSLGIQLKADGKGLVGELRLSEKELKRLQNQADKTSDSLNTSGGLLKGLAAGVAGLGLAKVARDLLDATVESQRLNASLVTVTGSALLADKAFSGLQQFAAETPFDLNQVVEGFIKLQSLGLTPSERALTSYGNTASAMGKSLNQLVEAVADAATGEFERLKEFGIRAKNQGDSIQFTFRGVTTQVQNDAAAIEGFLIGLGETEFAGGMQRQADTLGGAISNLGDAYTNLLADFGNAGAADAATGVIRFITETLENTRTEITNIQLASVALFAGFEKGLVSAGAEWDEFTTIIEALFGQAIEGVTESVGDFYGVLESGASFIGLDSLAASFGRAENASRALVEPAGDVEQRLAAIRAEAQANITAIDDLAFAQFDQIHQTLTQSASLDELAEQLRIEQEETGLTTEQLRALEKARKAAAQAAAKQAAADQKLLDRLNPLAAANKKYLADVAQLRRIFGANADSARGFQQALGALEQEYDDFVGSLGGEEFDELEARLADIRDDFRFEFSVDFDDATIDDLISQFDGLHEIQDAFDGIGATGEAAIDNIIGAVEKFSIAQKELDSDLDGSGRRAFRSYIQGAALALQGVQQFTKEGSKEFEALGVAVEVLQVAQGVLAVVNAMSTGDPYTALARGAAVLAAVVALGVNIGGSFGGGGSGGANIAADRQAATGTGSVLGDASAQSESIANAVEITAEASEALVGINSAMLNALNSIAEGVDGFGLLAARNGLPEFQNIGGGLNSERQIASDAFGAGFDVLNTLNTLVNVFFGGLPPVLADLVTDLGGKIGDTIQEDLFGGGRRVVDQGLLIGQSASEEGLSGGSFADLLREAAVLGFQEVRTSGGLLDGSSYDTITAEIDSEIGKQVNLIFQGIADSLFASADVLGISADEVTSALEAFELEVLLLSNKDLSAEEFSEQVSAAFSKIFDDVSVAVFPFLDEMQRLGEGAAETLIRIVSNIQIAGAGLDRLSIALDQTDPVALANLSTALIDAAGGLGEFIGLTDGFIGDFLSEAEQFDLATREMTAAFDQLDVALPASREDFAALIQGFEVTDEASSRLLVQLLQLAPGLDSLFDTMEANAEDATNALADLSDQMSSLADGLTADLDDLTRAYLANGSAIQAARGQVGSAQLGILRQTPGFNEGQYQQSLINGLRGELGSGSISDQAGVVGQLQAAITARYDAEVSRVNELQQAEQQAHQTALSNYETQRQAAEGLSRFLDELQLGDLSILTFADQFAESQRQFREALAGGDAGLIQATAQNYLTEARDRFASSEQFRDVFREVNSAVAGAATVQTAPPPHPQTLDSSRQLASLQAEALNELAGLQTLLDELDAQNAEQLASDTDRVIDSYAEQTAIIAGQMAEAQRQQNESDAKQQAALDAIAERAAQQVEDARLQAEQARQDAIDTRNALIDVNERLIRSFERSGPAVDTSRVA